ncbi:MAG: MBL fold metallo-hydrolase, partial [Nitriliruptorales bacterium]
MEIVTFVDEGLGNSSYLVEVGDGLAAAVDPSRDPTPYVREAERRGWRIGHVLETHLHADFISGGRELAALGAELVVPADSELAFPHRPTGDGEVIDLGGLEVAVLATPGHAPEHVSYLVTGERGPEVLFSGGLLLVGGVARPDLVGPEHTEPLARALFRSLRDIVRPLPDDLPVHPTHGAGSFCTAGGGDERATTVGAERANNPLLATHDEDEFVAAVLDGLGSYPAYFSWLRDVNRRGTAVHGLDRPRLAGLDAGELRSRLEGGGRVAGVPPAPTRRSNEKEVAEVRSRPEPGGHVAGRAPARSRRSPEPEVEIVDVRSLEEFAAGHVPGSLSIPLRSSFGSWLGWLVAPDRPLVFVTAPDTDEADLVRQCLNVGYEHLEGVIDGGIAAWVAVGGPLDTTELVAVGDIDGRPLVDVRQAEEYEAGHIPGAIPAELGSLHAAHDLPDGPLVVHCGHGERAVTGASVLARRGHDVAVLLG